MYSQEKRMLRKSGYASIPFTQGPRQKKNATNYYEKLIKDILKAYQDQSDIDVSYNSLNEIIITANNRFYNLAQLLKHKPDFEQISFSPDDLAIYDKFLRDPKTINGHIEDIATEDELISMSHAFPNMTRAEMSAIRHYTEDFYGPMNFLLKFNAAKPFPSPQDIDIDYGVYYFLMEVASKTDPNYNPLNPTYNPNNPVLIASAVREILLNTAITVSALSKPVQLELNICTVESYEDLQNNFKNIDGISLALIRNGTQYEIAMIAYGEIINRPLVLLDIQKLLLIHQAIQPDGISISSEELNEITLQLNTTDKINLLKNLSPLAKAKFIDILTAEQSVGNLLYEKIVRVEEDVDYFVQNYLPGINQTLNTSSCYNFYKVFFSASDTCLSAFKSPGLNIVTTLINPIMFGKNIQSISQFQDEEERLLIPGQQLAYTDSITVLDEKNQTEINLYGFPIRSIDGIEDSYSHDEMLSREEIISNKMSIKLVNHVSEKLLDIETKEIKTKVIETGMLQSSSASRVQPLYSELSRWFISAAKTTGNFLYQNLLEKPVAELGSFSEFYLDYLQKITIEQCAIGLLANNSHSLFSSVNFSTSILGVSSNLPKIK